MLVKDVVVLLPHSSFWILSHRILPDSTSNGSDSMGRCGTSNRTIKICLVTLSIAKNNINAITVGKEFNALIKVIHSIEVDANKVKISLWKWKQPNLYILNYIKGEK